MDPEIEPGSRTRIDVVGAGPLAKVRGRPERGRPERVRPDRWVLKKTALKRRRRANAFMVASLGAVITLIGLFYELLTR